MKTNEFRVVRDSEGGYKLQRKIHVLRLFSYWATKCVYVVGDYTPRTFETVEDALAQADADVAGADESPPEGTIVYQGKR